MEEEKNGETPIKGGSTVSIRDEKLERKINWLK